MITSPQSLPQFRADAVVVGGSAGAIEVLGQLLPGLSAASQVPVIVVMHLPPRRVSLLPRLFAARCQLPVREPEDKQPIGPGIWFAPPDYHLLVEAGRYFALSIDAPVKFSRPSIDVLFESAAEVYGAGLLGVVLTGANDDAALGACAIRKLGGVLAVQDPQGAEAQEMPRAAIRKAAPQLVGTVRELASMLIVATGGTP
jgi:two-component system chemotaxis response regulator CheB